MRARGTWLHWVLAPLRAAFFVAAADDKKQREGERVLERWWGSPCVVALSVQQRGRKRATIGRCPPTLRRARDGGLLIKSGAQGARLRTLPGGDRGAPTCGRNAMAIWHDLIDDQGSYGPARA
jgi:hypothetical protein